jgi:hypothetical protein
MQVGDKVKWTDVSQRGRSVSMIQKTGELVEINGNTATVKYGRNNRRKSILIERLQPVTEKGHLTQFVEAIVENNRNRPTED